MEQNIEKDWKSILRQPKTKSKKSVTWKEEDLIKTPSVSTLRWLWDRILKRSQERSKVRVLRKRLALEERKVLKKKMSQKEKRQEQTQCEGDQEKENIQGEMAEQQKKERLLRKLKRTNSIDLRLLLPPLELATPRLPSAVYKTSCESGSRTECTVSPAKFRSGPGQLKPHLVPLIKK